MNADARGSGARTLQRGALTPMVWKQKLAQSVKISVRLWAHEKFREMSARSTGPFEGPREPSLRLCRRSRFSYFCLMKYIFSLYKDFLDMLGREDVFTNRVGCLVYS